MRKLKKLFLFLLTDRPKEEKCHFNVSECVSAYTIRGGAIYTVIKGTLY